MSVECPVCFREDCELVHRECSPSRPLMCVGCGELMVRWVPDRLCGFCADELAGIAGRWSTPRKQRAGTTMVAGDEIEEESRG